MQPTVRGVLPLSSLFSDKAQSAFALDNLQTGSLVFLPSSATIIASLSLNVHIIKDDEIIITGTCMPNGLWAISIKSTMPQQVKGILRLNQPQQELATYHHAELCSPVPSTLLRAICQGRLTTFPGLMTKLISKHLPKTIATILGHQDQEAKHLCSTRTTNYYAAIDPSTNKSASDLAPELAPHTHQLCAMLFSKQGLLKSYSGQTGGFPVPSSHGNNYVFVLNHQDTNSIHALAIPNRKAACIHDAWELTHKLLVQQGHPSKLHIVDNECSHDLKDFFLCPQFKFQCVPPTEHQANAAERVIHTFKNHLIGILCTVDYNFLMSEWDCLIPQATLILNLLRSSCIHPLLSAHASLFGAFDFNQKPLAPLGTKIVTHIAANACTTFGPHSKIGWYIGPSPKNYRCLKCFFPDMLSKRDVLKVDFDFFAEKLPSSSSRAKNTSSKPLKIYFTSSKTQITTHHSISHCLLVLLSSTSLPTLQISSSKLLHPMCHLRGCHRPHKLLFPYHLQGFPRFCLIPPPICNYQRGTNSVNVSPGTCSNHQHTTSSSNNQIFCKTSCGTHRKSARRSSSLKHSTTIPPYVSTCTSLTKTHINYSLRYIHLVHTANANCAKSY